MFCQFPASKMMSETVVSPTTAAAAPVFAPIAPSNHSDHISNSNNGPVINNVAEISASHSSADPSHPVADNTTSSSTEGMQIFVGINCKCDIALLKEYFSRQICCTQPYGDYH